MFFLCDLFILKPFRSDECFSLFVFAENKDDRVKLLGKDIDAKPRVRTHEEIIATYRKAEVMLNCYYWVLLPLSK